MASIGKKMGPAVACLSFSGIEDSDRRGVSAIGRDAEQGTRRGGSKNNVAVGIPIASACLAGRRDALRSIGHGLHGAAAEVNPFQSAARKKTKLVVVGRPERKVSTFGTR